MGLWNTGGVMDKFVQMLDKNYGALDPDGPEEMGRALDGENFGRALKKKRLGRWRTEIGVERKERRK
ncbi:hypothetical protein TNCV_3108771 [Trichonephila clavipes]|uniref:Uncharacterized protein n=1 Tax=Trichonephila clavipes TaxID=2585209 RepID=A0A8X6SFU7_TRICX|nr:hypothetical protein TNCV_3108771 [Trichonephila clavipes]